MLIRVQNFQGVIPRYPSSALPESAAQTAQNSLLRSGEIRSVNDVMTAVDPAKSGTVNTIYLFGATAFRLYSGTIESITAADPVDILSTDHGRATGDDVHVGMSLAAPASISTSPSSAYEGETGLDITGTGFEAAQGTGGVYLHNVDEEPTKGIEQTITGWGATAIEFTAVLGHLVKGAAYLTVVSDVGAWDSDSITLAEKAYVPFII